MIIDTSCGYCDVHEVDPLCGVHFPPPSWLPAWAQQFALRWRRAKRDPEQGELTNADHAGIVHGWWLTPTTWGAGVEVDTDRDDHPGVLIQLGPFCWCIARAYRLP